MLDVYTVRAPPPRSYSVRSSNSNYVFNIGDPMFKSTMTTDKRVCVCILSYIDILTDILTDKLRLDIIPDKEQKCYRHMTPHVVQIC